ncbi:MAG TPA: choice-of-anchor E domain-containing protein [Falsiroseomonas sp.]|jgi:hypothetical protein|nr:choice-of-anchor E domain-containing protein [Falsiroseomonas sp.]
MRLAPVLAGGFLMVMLASASASAATIAQTAALASTPVPVGTSGFNTSFAVNKFDPGLGTLTEIRLEFTGGVSGSATLARTSQGPNPVNYRVDLGNDFALRVGSTMVAELQNVVSSNTVSVPRGGSASTTLAPVSNSVTSTLTQALSPALFSQFTGTTGSVSMALQILRDNSFAQLTGGNGTLVAPNNPFYVNFATGDLRVTFTFTSTSPAAVTEPLTLSLFGLGLIGLAAVRRRSAAA